MKFFSLFRRTERKGVDSTVDSEEVVEHKAATNNTDEVETTLALRPEWNVPQEQEYVFRFLSNELKPLKPNQLSLAGIEIDVEEANGTWLVKAFFRSSLSDAISLEKLPLLLIDKEGKILAEKEFDLSELGTVPPQSDVPWVFVFDKETQAAEEPPADGWQLAFNRSFLVAHSLDLEPAWEEGLTEEQKTSLQQTVERLPKLKPKEVNFVGFHTHFKEDGGLDVSLFVRNGYTKEINLEKLPLEVIDSTGQVVCRGSFDLPPLSVKPNTSKPWTFTFPKELIQLENPDLSRWTARVSQS